MDLLDKILSKEYINDRFVEAVYLLLNTKIVPDKASIAEALKCKPSKFSEILNGRMKAGIDMVAYICEYFNISPDWILLSRGEYFRTAPAPSIFVSEGPGSDDYKRAIESHFDSLKSETEVCNTQGDSNVEALLTIIKDKDASLRELAEEVGRLKEQIRQLTIEKEKHVSAAHTSGTANVG